MKKLNSHHLSYKCPLKWDDLEHSGTGRFCHQCKNKVYDLSDCTVKEAVNLQKKHGTICGWVPVAASAILAMTSCVNNNTDTVNQPIEEPVNLSDDVWIGGVILPLDQAGGSALQKQDTKTMTLSNRTDISTLLPSPGFHLHIKK